MTSNQHKLLSRIWWALSLIVICASLAMIGKAIYHKSERRAAAIQNAQTVILSLPSTLKKESTALPVEEHQPSDKVSEPSSAPSESEQKSTASASSSLPTTSSKLAIIIVGVGLSESTTRQALSLPKEVTLGFSPYSYQIAELAKQATEGGHEAWVHLPMEPLNYPIDDQGPFALLTQSNDTENASRFEWITSRFTKFKGTYSIGDEKFTAAYEGMRFLLNLLKDKNLPFLYASTRKNSAFLELGKSMALPIFTHDILLDEEISGFAIEKKLMEAEVLAQRKGYAVVIARPYPVTLNIIKNWLNTNTNKHVQLIPLSSLRRTI